MTEEELTVWEAKRDLNSELLESIESLKQGVGLRKTQFHPQADGSMRRVVLRTDGSLEKDEIVSRERWEIATARANSGLSQAAFAQLLGVSKRTLQEWEQGRKHPSGAARVLLRIAATHPEILREAAAL